MYTTYINPFFFSMCMNVYVFYFTENGDDSSSDESATSPATEGR